MTSNSTPTPPESIISTFYLIDFALRYPVARCASDDDWTIALMSLLTITSAWAWVAGFVLGYFKVRIAPCNVAYSNSASLLLRRHRVYLLTRALYAHPCVLFDTRKVRLYLQIARHTLWALTLVHVVMMYVFHQPPPVAGCGPLNSFPSSQTTLSAYALGVSWFYEVSPLLQSLSPLSSATL